MMLDNRKPQTAPFKQNKKIKNIKKANTSKLYPI